VAQEIVPLGKLITEPHPARDAVHIAVEPVIAAGPLGVNARLKIVGTDDKTGLLLVDVADGPEAAGIVDPFLPYPPVRGERFFLCLFPNTVTSLKHFWSHPAFPDRNLTDDDKARAARSKLMAMIPGAKR